MAESTDENFAGSETLIERSGKYVVTTEDKTEDWVILTIAILIIIIFWSIVIFLALTSIPQLQSSTGGQVLVRCPVGQCATNIYTGEKRCPTVEGTIVSNAGFEVCSSRYVCDNVVLPYALKSDGSVEVTGVCETGVTCRCARRASCPEYVTTFFQTSSGNAYDGLSGTRTRFVQNNTWRDIYTGAPSDSRPIEYDNFSNGFCTIPTQWLSRSTPGCTFTDNITYDTVQQCMEYQSGCSGVQFNPCLEGSLAYVMDDSSLFTKNSVNSIPVACVAAQPCGCGEVAIWDRGYGGVVCLDSSLVPPS